MNRVQQKVSQGLDVLTFFTMREWLFDSTKFQQVFNELDSDDKELYELCRKKEFSLIKKRIFFMHQILYGHPRHY